MSSPQTFEEDNIKAVLLRTQTHIWVHLNGRTHSIEVVNKRAHKQQSQEKDPTRILAPMPGKIIKVLCGAGDQVSPGQTLIVMEAMKMEYALKSTLLGVVTNRPVVAGMQVALGDLLVQLKAKDV
jgi:3-methylcrotonyl-CoA carboxylase alpha subunit